MSDSEKCALVEAMRQPSFYDHPTGQIKLIETHISWVFLAGDFVYKVKKPVNFGFLDFSSLEKRRHCCEEELRLNRRFAPQLYLGIVSFGGDSLAPTLNGQPTLEYAVKMRRFPQSAQLDRMLADGELDAPIIERFASYIADLHQGAPSAPSDLDYGSPQAVLAPVTENFKQIRPLLPSEEIGNLDQVEHWSLARWKELHPLFRQRKAEGFVRECHGDLHLANMAWVGGQPILFDGIEFNPGLRWIDLISDIAFLTMDLDDRQQSALGWGFLNRYLQEAGDYPGLQLLDFYQTYRAMVRAKVYCLRLAQPGVSETEHRQDLALYHSYLNLAASYTRPKPTQLLICHGLSASGKSTFSTQLAACLGAVQLQSDRERKRLFNLAADAASGSGLDEGIYNAEATVKTYVRLQELAGLVLSADYPAIVDATFLQQAQREGFQRLAAAYQCPLTILDFRVAEAELRRRLRQRADTGADISEATTEVLDQQLRQRQPLTGAELQLSIPVTSATSPQELATALRQPP